MKSVSPAKAQRRKQARQGFQDGVGVNFSEVRLWLPPRVSDWPKVRIVDCKENRGEYTDRLGCFYCERCVFGPMDVHHIVGGSRGRCDSLTNLMPVCRKCHEEIQSVPALLPHVLYQKWKHDRAHVSWVRLTLLAGRWLDDLELGPRK